MKSIGKTFILIVLVLIVAQSFVLVIQTYQSFAKYKQAFEVVGTGKAAGVVSLCINSQPILNLSNCSSNVTQDIYYQCWLNATDTDYSNFTYTSQFTEISRAFNNSQAPLFTVTSEGFVNFTPSNEDVGNFTILFAVNDGMGCDNSQDSSLFYLQVINVNDPPYLTDNLSDQSINEGELIYPFYLDTHFHDPDNDELNYSVILSNAAFIVTINNDTSRVSISASSCPATGIAIFVAQDPYGETGTSNAVSLACLKEEEPGGGTGGTGSGGGGGGAFEPCKSEYECYDYHKCNRSNVKVQRCVDINGCDKDVFLVVPCKYEEEILCNESWNCSDWGPCLPNGTQERTCVDVNNCKTIKDMPPLIQECEYIGTCNDGIKSCHEGSCEEGIDCGGPCPPCKSIEVPYPFEEERSILIYIITGIVLLLLAAILLYHYFRKEIDAALAKAGWIITRRRRKQLLLPIEDKRKILAGLLELEHKLDRLELFESLNKYSELLRYYFIKVYREALSPEFDLEELKAVLSKQKARVREILRKIFVSSFTKYLKVEQNKSLITKRNITLLIEELRNLALQTSKVEPEDAAREVKELTIPEKSSPVEKIIIMVINAYIALEFLELEVSKKKYLEILSKYDELKVKEQEDIFEDVSRLYHNISYVNSWLEKPKEI